jgi:hypothetical protein
MPSRLSHSLALTSADAHNLLTSRSNASVESPMHRSSRVGIVGIAPHPTLSSRRSHERPDDTLTGAEKKAIESLFYKAGPIATSSAAESLLGSFGWTLTEEERMQWFPEEAEASEGGEPPSRHRPPVTKDEVLDVMRRKKIQFLALSEDKENETLATFVALGGRYDATGTADITILIEAVQQLRGDPRSKTKSSRSLMDATMTVTAMRAFSSSVANNKSSSSSDEDDDAGDKKESMATSLTHDYMLTTQLRTMPRILRFPEFVDAFQSLRTAASSGGAVSPQRALLQQTVPGTPTEQDLRPVTVVGAARHVAQSFGARSVSVIAPHAQFVNGGANGAMGSRGGVTNSLLGVPALRTSVDDGDEWSDGETATDMASEEEPSPCVALRQSVEDCVSAFRARRAPESTLERITTMPPSLIAPMSSDGTTWTEIIAARKFTSRKTVPVTPLMMIREKAQQEILELESAAILEKQLNARLQSKARGPLRPASSHGVRKVTSAEKAEHKAKASLIESSDANEFVGKLARHLEFLERSAGRQPLRPSSACDDVGPASRLARQGAPALVHKWKQGTAAKLVAQRERALELAIAQQVRMNTSADSAAPPTSGLSSITHVVADVLQPPVAGFERRAASPFLAYPQAGVYRRAPSPSRWK